MRRWLWRWWCSFFTSAGLMSQKCSKYIKLGIPSKSLPVNTKQIEPSPQANVDSDMDVDDVHGSNVRAEIWRLSRVGARWKWWIMQTTSPNPPRDIKTKFIRTFPCPSSSHILHIHLSKPNVVLWDSTVVNSSPCWTSLSFELTCFHSMILWPSASDLFRGVDEA